MARHAETLRPLLAPGPCSARQLVEKTGLSQPTLSRALNSLGEEVVRIGAGTAIRYALRDSARGLPPLPIFRVSAAGQIQQEGTLIPVRPDGFVLQQAGGGTQHSDGLPWWLFDLRPQGYLGRAWAAVHAAPLGLPANPEHWSDTDVIRALLTQGHDAIGNLLLGERARENFLALPSPAPMTPTSDFPALARAASAGELPGSSAGGEQPKFCAYGARGHVLVKFSAPDANPVSERWRDLLLAEHLALALLGVDSAVFDIAGQRFLEVPRFDRVGELGRIGVVSLRALDAEFVGNAAAPWPTLVSRLVAAGLVEAEAGDGAALRWAFGTLIGNTDMHAGNLSFLALPGRRYPLAPAYDMLPMGFAPSSSGALGHSLPAAALTATIPGASWRQALDLARRYLEQLTQDRRFSPGFAPCLSALERHLSDAATRIARLG
ncbi:MAG: hypothetical protein RIR00_2030 [Pseudomonadota bacterium]|jgi:hypothetical protein